MEGIYTAPLVGGLYKQNAGSNNSVDARWALFISVSMDAEPASSKDVNLEINSGLHQQRLAVSGDVLVVPSHVFALVRDPDIFFLQMLLILDISNSIGKSFFITFYSAS